MYEQLSIDFHARARRTDPATSKAAARRVQVLTLNERVLANLRYFGPADSDTLAMRMGMKLVTISPRLRPLERKGLVRVLEVRDRKIVWSVA